MGHDRCPLIGHDTVPRHDHPAHHVPTERRKSPDRTGLDWTDEEQPLTALQQVRGRSSKVWRVQDSNLGSFRDGFTVSRDPACSGRLRSGRVNRAEDPPTGCI